MADGRTRIPQSVQPYLATVVRDGRLHLHPIGAWPDQNTAWREAHVTYGPHLVSVKPLGLHLRQRENWEARVG